MFDLRIGNDPINHDLKILNCYFESQLSEVKTFEVRKNDRDFRVGDTIILREIDSSGPAEDYKVTGRTLLVGINYILNSTHDALFKGIEVGYCIISTEILK